MTEADVGGSPVTRRGWVGEGERSGVDEQREVRALRTSKLDKSLSGSGRALPRVSCAHDRATMYGNCMGKTIPLVKWCPHGESNPALKIENLLS